MAIDIVARALAVSGKQNLENYYTKTESDGRYVKSVADKRVVYANGETGEQATFAYNASPTAWTFPIYNGAAQLSTTDPTEALHAVNKQYGDSNYFNKIRVELKPTTGTVISKEQLIGLLSGLYWIAQPSTIYDLDDDGWFNLEVFNSSSHKTLLVETATNDMYMAQILTDTHRTFTGWHQVATTNYVNNKVAVVEFVQPVDKDNIGNILALTDEQYNKLLNTETAFIVYGNDIYRKNISGDEYNGMMFESISGQFDYSADFYLTTAYMSDSDYASQQISVGSVTGLSLGLPVSFYTPSNVAIEKLSNRRITSIDSTNKKITVDGGFIGSSLRLAEGSLLKVPTTSPHKKLTNTIINGSDETNIVNVDETRSLTVGMAISFHVPDGGLMAGGVGRIITAIDSANKTITVSGVALDSDMVSSGSYITLYQSKPTSGKLKVLYQNVSDSKYLSFSEIDLNENKKVFSVTIYEAGE